MRPLRVWILGCLSFALFSVAAKSNVEPRVVVAVFDVGFQGIEQLSTNRVIRKQHTAQDPVEDSDCLFDYRYNGTGAYEKTWGWNFLGCGARRTNGFINNKDHGYRMARQILEGTRETAVIPIASVVDTAGQHILFQPVDSFRKPMQMASALGARIINMSFALSPPYEPESISTEKCGRICQFKNEQYQRYLTKFEKTKQAFHQLLSDYAETIFVAASGNATRLYQNGRFVYQRNDLKYRLPQALHGEHLPNLFVVSLCDEKGRPKEMVNFSKAAVDVCVYRPAPYTVSLEKTHLHIRRPWASDAAATFSNIVAKILETRDLSPSELRTALLTYPGVSKDPQGRYDYFVNYPSFSVEVGSK